MLGRFTSGTFEVEDTFIFFFLGGGGSDLVDLVQRHTRRRDFFFQKHLLFIFYSTDW
jgi:hypothetical protein